MALYIIHYGNCPKSNPMLLGTIMFAAKIGYVMILSTPNVI